MNARCERCDDNGVITVAVAGPDYWGNYDTDEILCPECNDIDVVRLAEALARDEREAEEAAAFDSDPF